MIDSHDFWGEMVVNEKVEIIGMVLLLYSPGRTPLPPECNGLEIGRERG